MTNSDKPLIPKESNPLSELRLLMELFTMTTLFLLSSVILFSEENNIALVVLGWIYVAVSLIPLLLMFIPKIAKRFGEWIENHEPTTKNQIVRMGFLFLLWLAFSITYFVALTDVTPRLPEKWQVFGLIAGLFLFVLATIGLSIPGFRTMWLLNKK